MRAHTGSVTDPLVLLLLLHFLYALSVYCTSVISMMLNAVKEAAKGGGQKGGTDLYCALRPLFLMPHHPSIAEPTSQTTVMVVWFQRASSGWHARAGPGSVCRLTVLLPGWLALFFFLHFWLGAVRQ